MLSQIRDTTRNTPWSLAELLYALDDVHDEEGRPLGERRASSEAKKGVEMVLRECPYRDARQGSPMNVSALKQVLRPFDEVMNELRAFQRSLPGPMKSQHRLLCAVVDLLAAPAMFLLGTWPENHPLPIHLSVGYKLAAGFFSLARDFPPTNDSAHKLETAILDFIKERRLLFGASEVCAGPPNMIQQTTQALLERPSDGEHRVSSNRIQRAIALAAQLRLGTMWRTLDRTMEHRLLVLTHEDALHLRTSFLSREVGHRRTELAQENTPSFHEALGFIPLGLAPNLCVSMKAHIEDRNRISDLPWTKALLEANRTQEAAIVVDASESESIFGDIAWFLRCRFVLYRTLHALERDIRKTLEFSTSTGFDPSRLIFPPGKALRWIEAILGAQVSIHHDPSPGAPSMIRLKNHRREIRLDVDF